MSPHPIVILAQANAPAPAPAPSPTPTGEAPPTVEAPAQVGTPTDGTATTAAPGSAPPTTTPKVDPPWWANPMFGVFIALALFLLFSTRAKRNQDKKRTDMLSNLKRGDRVQTIGGILGTVVEAKEHDVLLKVDESSNTKIRFSRSAIHRVLEEDGKATEVK